MGGLVTSVDGEHVYTLDTWPLTIALAGAAVCLAAVVLRAALRARAPNVSWARALALVLGLFGLLGGLAWSGIVWVNVVFQHALWPPARTTWKVFPTPMIEGSALGATAALLALAYGILAQRRFGPSKGAGRVVAPILSIVLAGGFVAAQSGPAFSSWLQGIGGLPRIASDSMPWIHAGESFQLRPTLEAGASGGWDTPRPIRVASAPAGRLRLHASSTNGMLHIDRRWVVRARSATSHPSLPLRVGNRWQYRWHQASSGALLWGIVRTTGPSSEGRFELSVTRTRTVHGIRQFQLSRFDPRGTARHWWVYPLEGRTHILEGAGPASTDPPLDLPFPGSDAAFSIPMLPGACHGVSRGRLPGPCTCESRGGADVPSIVAAVVTAGLVIPRSSDRTVLVLESSELGGGPAAEVAPVPPQSRNHATAAPSCELPNDRRTWFCVVARADGDATPEDIARRFTRAGLPATALADGRVVARARRDQAARILGARVRGRPIETSPCPGWRCRPEILRERAAAATVGVASLALDLDACATLP